MADPYEVLGVHRHAGTEDIKRAYRRLVRECHPDLNPAPAAERRFKAVSSAYAVLSDTQRRAWYDEFGEDSLLPGFDPHVARQYTAPRSSGARAPASPFGDLSGFHEALNAAFDPEAYEPVAEPAGDHHVQATITPLVAFTGGMTTVSIRLDNGRVETMRIRIKAGARSGDTVTLPGMAPTTRHQPPGDLVVELDVPEHPVLRRSGDDLEMDVPITLLEAVQGGPITVPTPTGLKRVNLPPNCAGARLRLRGRGIQRSEAPGHLILHLRPVLPEHVDATVLEACRTIERAYRGDVRDRIRL